MPMPIDKKLVEGLAKKLADEGLLIEGGWVGLKLRALPSDAPDDQIRMMRDAFFAGAAHLFSTILGILDEDREPTQNDLRRMELINKELDSYIDDFKQRHGL